MPAHHPSICVALKTDNACSPSRTQVLDTPEPLRNLAELVAAQMEYHKKAYEILSELAPLIEGLQVEQEASRDPGYALR